MQIGLKVNDGILSIAVRQFWMIRTVNHAQHNRSRTKIERHEVPDPATWMAINREN
jgi:hypothetical protein